MTLRKKLFLLTTASFALAVLAGGIHQWNAYRKLIKAEEDRFCKESLGEYMELVNFHKTVANAVSSYVAKDREVIKAVAGGNREELYRRLRPLYEEMSRDGLIREMVIFKLPAVTFLNVRNPKAPQRDVSRIRGDVVRAGKTCTSTQTILICINYVGIRSSNPILMGDEVVGVASVGIDMKDFLSRYTEITGQGSGLAVSDSALKMSLLDKSYERYVGSRLKVKGYVVETRGELSPRDVPIDLLGLSTSRFRIGERTFVLCSKPLEDFSGRIIGYFFTYRDFTGFAAQAALGSLRDLILLYVPPLFFVFALLLVVLSRIYSRIERTLRIIDLVKQKRFEDIRGEETAKVRDEIDRIRAAILEMAEEIKSYVDTLSKEVDLYTSKAYLDGLTEVFNRRAFEEFGKKFLEKMVGIGKPVSVLMIDIDNFKDINDSFGHQVGDMILSEVAQVIRETLRDSDMVFRYGGEEFVVILPGTNLSGALKAAENVRRRVELASFKVNGREVRLTVSIGAAEGKKGESVEDLIERADKSLYIAKKTGKNRVVGES